MCGIAGTIYKKNYLPGIKVEVDELVQLFSKGPVRKCNMPRIFRLGLEVQVKCEFYQILQR